MRDSTSFKRLLTRIDSQWRQTRQRGRVWKQGFRQKAEEVSRDKTLHTNTHRVESRCRATDSVLPWKQTCCWMWSAPHEKTTKQNQTPTCQTDSHENRTQTRLRNPSVQRQEIRNNLRYSGKSASTPGLLKYCTSADTRAAAAHFQGHHEAEPVWQSQGAQAIHGAPSMASTNHQFKMQARASPCDSGLG